MTTPTALLPTPEGSLATPVAEPAAAAVPDARPAPPVARRKAAPKPVPTPQEAYAHLSVLQLRELRELLTAEESRVSYWRRILQARLDVLVAGTSSRLDPARLAPVLTDAKVGAGRQALSRLLPIDGEPPLPSLAELWDRQVDLGDAVERAALVDDLRVAERQLSSYRAALHTRISEATDDLIARYRQDPQLCLSALPLRRR